MKQHIIEVAADDRDAWFEAMEAKLAASGGIMRQAEPGLFIASRWPLAYHVELPAVAARPARDGAAKPLDLSAPSGREETWIFNIDRGNGHSSRTGATAKSWFEGRAKAAVVLQCEPGQMDLVGCVR